MNPLMKGRKMSQTSHFPGTFLKHIFQASLVLYKQTLDKLFLYPIFHTGIVSYIKQTQVFLGLRDQHRRKLL